MQHAQDAPGANNGVPDGRGRDRAAAESTVEVGQEGRATTDTTASNQELQATVEDGPIEEVRGVGNEARPAIGTSILQERSEEAEPSSTQQSESLRTEGLAGVNNLNLHEGVRTASGAPGATSVDQPIPADSQQNWSRPEQSTEVDEQTAASVAAQATSHAVQVEQVVQPVNPSSYPSQPSAQQSSEQANLAPPLHTDVTSASQREPATAELPDASASQTPQSDNAPPISNTQTEEQITETDRPPIPIENTRQPYSSQPTNARFGPAAGVSGSATSGQGSAGAATAARGMPMRE